MNAVDEGKALELQRVCEQLPRLWEHRDPIDQPVGDTMKAPLIKDGRNTSCIVTATLFSRRDEQMTLPQCTSPSTMTLAFIETRPRWKLPDAYDRGSHAGAVQVHLLLNEAPVLQETVLQGSVRLHRRSFTKTQMPCTTGNGWNLPMRERLFVPPSLDPDILHEAHYLRHHVGPATVYWQLWTASISAASENS